LIHKLDESLHAAPYTSVLFTLALHRGSSLDSKRLI